MCKNNDKPLHYKKDIISLITSSFKTVFSKSSVFLFKYFSTKWMVRCM